MEIIAVANQKGGCGKTTTAINLAACLGKRKKRTLLIDMDPQGHASLGLGLKCEEREGLYEVFLREVTLGEVILQDAAEGVDLVPGTISLAAVEHLLADTPEREWRLASHIAQLDGRYEYVIIDCPPSLGLLAFNALRAADRVIVPMEMSAFSLDGVERLTETIDLLSEKYQSNLPVTVVPTMVDLRPRFTREMMRELADLFPRELSRASIHYTIRLKEAVRRGMPVTAYDGNCIAAQDYDRLAREVLGEQVGKVTVTRFHEVVTPKAAEKALAAGAAHGTGETQVVAGASAEADEPAEEAAEPLKEMVAGAGSDVHAYTVQSPVGFAVPDPDEAEEEDAPMAAMDDEDADNEDMEDDDAPTAAADDGIHALDSTPEGGIALTDEDLEVLTDMVAVTVREEEEEEAADESITVSLSELEALEAREDEDEDEPEAPAFDGDLSAALAALDEEDEDEESMEMSAIDPEDDEEDEDEESMEMSAIDADDNEEDEDEESMEMSAIDSDNDEEDEDEESMEMSAIDADDDEEDEDEESMEMSAIDADDDEEDEDEESMEMSAIDADDDEEDIEEDGTYSLSPGKDAAGFGMTGFRQAVESVAGRPFAHLDEIESQTRAKAGSPAVKREVAITFSDYAGRRIQVAGDFNGWIPDRGVHTTSNDDQLIKTLKLEPGDYQYRVIVDGIWQEDPGNPNRVPNIYGGSNSLLRVDPPLDMTM